MFLFSVYYCFVYTKMYRYIKLHRMHSYFNNIVNINIYKNSITYTFLLLVGSSADNFKCISIIIYFFANHIFVCVLYLFKISVFIVLYFFLTFIYVSFIYNLINKKNHYNIHMVAYISLNYTYFNCHVKHLI